MKILSSKKIDGNGLYLILRIFQEKSEKIKDFKNYLAHIFFVLLLVLLFLQHIWYNTLFDIRIKLFHVDFSKLRIASQTELLLKSFFECTYTLFSNSLEKLNNVLRSVLMSIRSVSYSIPVLHFLFD